MRLGLGWGWLGEAVTQPASNDSGSSHPRVQPGATLVLSAVPSHQVSRSWGAVFLFCRAGHRDHGY